jgi:hypothetical protein
VAQAGAAGDHRGVGAEDIEAGGVEDPPKSRHKPRQPGRRLPMSTETRQEQQPLDRDPAAIGETQDVSAQDDVREEIGEADVQPREAPERPPQQHRAPRQERPQYEARRFQTHQPRQRHPDQEAARQHGSAIHEAIQDVEQIITDLRETLEEMEEVLETLELAEREKTADEREIEQLRRTLKGLHRGRDNGPRQGQYSQGQHRGEGRERRSFRGSESHEARPQRASEEHRASETPHGEPEHHETPASRSADRKTGIAAKVTTNHSRVDGRSEDRQVALVRAPL